MIKEFAYAKINLGLDVLEKRHDGFHAVNNLMIPLQLHDVLYLEKIESGIDLVDETNILKEDNFCYKAAKLFIRTFNINAGVRIKLVKHIPQEAGLAGGSSDASAVLRGMNRLFNLGLSLNELEPLAAELGSDMPYCLYQKLSLCSGRGEIVKVLPNIKYNDLNVLLIKPHFGLSTKLIYDNFIFDGISKRPKIDDILIDLSNNDIEHLENDIFNDLTNPALKTNEELSKIIEIIKSFNINVFMSGSGPTLFILNIDSNIEKELKEKLKNVEFFSTKFNT